MIQRVVKESKANENDCLDFLRLIRGAIYSPGPLLKQFALRAERSPNHDLLIPKINRPIKSIFEVQRMTVKISHMIQILFLLE